jgi:hypothetical protein
MTLEPLPTYARDGYVARLLSEATISEESAALPTHRLSTSFQVVERKTNLQPKSISPFEVAPHEARECVKTNIIDL